MIMEYPGGADFFVTGIRVSPAGKISVFVDRMAGITIDECARISRFIESRLDRDREDFELVVSSPGLDAPFTVPEQYLKNIGKKIKVLLNNGETRQGVLTAMENDEITLEITEKKKKSSRKGEKTNDLNINTAVFPLAEIKTAKLSIEIK